MLHRAGSTLKAPRMLALIGALVIGVLAAGNLARADATDTEVVAYFASTDGIYPGDEVRVLGVGVGTIDSITPEGDEVRVEFTVDGDVTLPADVQAAIVSPSLVSSRYIQLTPRYDGGPTYDEGTEIPLERTAVPVEWDEIKDQLNELAVALGPRGANKDGSLSRLVDTGAQTLKGQGRSINSTIAQLARAIDTLDRGGDDAFSTVRNLQVFTTALAASDQQLAEFIDRLDEVSGIVADDKELVRTALRDLSTTVGVVETFVQKNRGRLNRSLVSLTDVTSVVAKQQDDLAQILHVAPNALANLNESYHQRQNAVGVNLVAANINSPGQLLCGAFGGATGSNEQQTAQLCQSLIGDLLDQVANSPQSQQLLQALLLILGGGE